MHSGTAVARPPRRQRTQSLRLPVVANWRLQVARDNAGLSIPQLAALAGIPGVQTVYDAENGVRRTTNSTRKRIVQGLNKQLLIDDPSATPYKVTDFWPSALEQTR